MSSSTALASALPGPRAQYVAAPRIAAGSAEFTRSNRALFFGGFSCFALLYCVQPLMPLLSREFALSAAQSSMALSVSTGALALSLVASSALSERLGRKTMMAGALGGTALFTLLSAAAHNFAQLLVLRALLGFALGGMPAVAMAYLSEEIAPPSLGLAMGYIGGSALGGMAGRLLVSVISDFYSWRVAIALMGAAGFALAWEFWRSLPASRNFRGGKGGWPALLRGARAHLADDGLPWLFALAFRHWRSARPS